MNATIYTRNDDAQLENLVSIAAARRHLWDLWLCLETLPNGLRPIAETSVPTLLDILRL